MGMTITKFRNEIFEQANQALDGQEVSFTHKGKRLRVVPDDLPDKPVEQSVHWLDRLTPMEIYNPNWVEPAVSYQDEMQQEWEEKWADFFDRLP